MRAGLVTGQGVRGEAFWGALLRVAPWAALRCRGSRYFLHRQLQLSQQLPAPDVLTTATTRMSTSGHGAPAVLSCRCPAPPPSTTSMHLTSPASMTLLTDVLPVCLCCAANREALSAQRPWAGMRSSALVTSVATKGARLPINRGWSLQLQGLLRRAWRADPASRPSAQEATGAFPVREPRGRGGRGGG